MKTNKLFQIIICLLLSATVAQAQGVSFTFTAESDMSAGFRAKMENAVSMLLTEINSARDGRRELDLQSLDMQPEARQRICMLWKTMHFYCKHKAMMLPLLEDAQGYQVRGIAIAMDPVSSGYSGAMDRDLVIGFNRNGMITSVIPATESTSYASAFGNGHNVTDTRRRREIMKFVEEYFSYYETKNIDALRNIFSDDALIITGCVMMKKPVGDLVRAEAQVRYKRQNKAQYIANLQASFAKNEYIKIDIADVKISRSGSNANVYGVTLRQKYRSSTYSDDGYVFLLWDFVDEQHPQIHVRTWQPLGNVAPGEVFTMYDFLVDE